MSGGSHDYLCYTDFPEIMGKTKEMEEMETELIRLGYLDIAKDVRRLIEYCHTARNRVESLWENLSEVFHDIEWECSGDISRETLIERLEKYRKGETANEN
jgi:hypothetical protein